MELFLWLSLAIAVVVAIVSILSQTACSVSRNLGNTPFDYYTEKTSLWSLICVAVLSVAILVFYLVQAILFPVNGGTIVDKMHTEARDEEVFQCITVGTNPCGTTIFDTIHHPECYGVVIRDGEREDIKCLPEQEWNSLNVGEHYTYTG